MAKNNKIEWAKNRLAELKVKKNMVNDEDKAAIEESIANVTELISALEADEAEHDMAPVMSKLAELEETLKAVTEKMADEPAEPAAENYLHSSNSVRDWLHAIRTNGKKGADNFKKVWGDTLRTNGITITEGDEFAFMPDYVRGIIQDKWDKKSNWLNQLHNTGAKAFAIRYDSTDEDTANARARGHKNGDTKTEITSTLVAKEVNCQFVYSLCSLDNLTVYEDDGSLVKYITDTLYERFLYEMRRVILIGDGRSSATPDLRIKKFESYLRASTDAFVTVGTVDTSNALVDELVNNLASIKNADNDITLFMCQADLNTLRRVQFGDDATPQYVSREIVAEQLGVKEIIITDMMNNSTSGAARFIAARLNGYITVGNMLNPSFATWEDYDKNVTKYRLEAPCGGAVEALSSAIVLKNS